MNCNPCLGWCPRCIRSEQKLMHELGSTSRKQFTGKRKLSIPEFMRLLQMVVKRQRTEEDLALIELRALKMDKNYME